MRPRLGGLRVYEATGRYHRDFKEALAGAGLRDLGDLTAAREALVRDRVEALTP